MITLLSLLSACDALYNQRAINMNYAVQAAECYQRQIGEVQESADDATLAGLVAQQSLSHAWIILRTQDASQKRAAIDSGLTLADKMLAKGLSTANYWKAVFVTFDCQDRDGSSVIPKCMFRNLGYLQSQLLSAQKASPSIHGYGPDRVYGIMYMEMPRVVGGSTEIARQHLKRSYELAPQLTMNTLFYAKLLIRIGQKEEARTILQKLINKPGEEFDPASIPETLEDQAEAKKMMATL